MWAKTLCVITLCCFSALALETAYVTFEHPEGWQCELSQGVWICQSNNSQDRKESVVLSIAAQATQWDTVDNYVAYLKKPRVIQDDKGKKITSKITYVRKRKINGYIWADSLQQNSELPGFWARYLATVHQTQSTRLAILITYIVSNKRYQNLAPQFERMISSLKPRTDFDSNVASKQGEQVLPGSTVLGQMQKSILERLKPVEKNTIDEPKPMPSNKDFDTTLIFIVLGIAGAYFYMRRRRQLKKKLKSNTSKPNLPSEPQK